MDEPLARQSGYSFDVPTYDFECQTCHKHVEQQHSMSAAPGVGKTSPDPCPQCRTATLVRVLSVPVIFAGAALKSSNQYPYASQRFNRQQLPGCKVDRGGHPIIESRRHERNLMAEHGLARE